MKFEEALKEMRKGNIVQRKAWTDGPYTALSISVSGEQICIMLDVEAERIVEKSIDSDDILADDWEVLKCD